MNNFDIAARYEELLGNYLSAIRRLASAYTRNTAAREDLVQEIAMSLWTALPRFRGDSSERTWVYRVAHNTAISFVAANSRRARREESVENPESAAPLEDPETQAIQEQRRRRLYEAIRELPMADRKIVVLHLEGLGARDIEDVTGMSSGSIATRLTRARQKLADAIRLKENV